MRYDKQMGSKQFVLSLSSHDGPSSKDEVLRIVRALILMHEAGDLGGEKMPEDVHPDIPPDSKELAHYFTLGMALNYQRNSYSLWRSCTAAWTDETRRWIFDPQEAATRSIDDLREALVLHRVALQPNNHVKIWRTISQTLAATYGGDVRKLFEENDCRISLIKDAISREKKGFPYLAGTKICNYWLYVMLSYTQLGLTEKSALNVAPDTHVINASAILGVITDEEKERPDARDMVADRWKELLSDTGLDPIDIHTPLWLWSRAGFVAVRRTI